MRPRPAVLLGLALVAGYLGTRLWRLGALPMFIDEGGYITWSLHALHAQRVGDLLISVTDGKQPLFPWLMAPFLALVPDRLLAARLTTVASGAVGAAAAYALCRRLYGAPEAVLAVVVYVVAPLTFFYDRIALYDGPIATLGLLSLATAVWWLDRPTWTRTGVLGVVLGLTALTKVSALVIVGAAPLAAFALLPRRRAHRGRVLAAYALAAALFGVLLLHPQAAVLFRGTTDRYALSPSDLVTLPWRVWQDNLSHLTVALTGYLPAPLWVVYAAGLLLPVVTRDRRDAVLAGWCLLLLGSTLLLDKVFYFRYYVPGAVAGLLVTARVLGLAVRGLSRLRPRTGVPDGIRWWPAGLGWGLGAGLLLLAALPSLRLQWQLWHDPYRAAIPGDVVGDREQYVLSRNAGWEVDGLVDYLRARAAHEPLVVVVSPLTGHMRAWVEARLLYVPGVHVVLRDPSETPRAQILGLDRDDEVRRLAVSGGAVFYADSEWASAPGEQPYAENDDPTAELVGDFPRLDMAWRHRVYRLQFPRELDTVRLARPPSFGAGGEISLLGYDLEPPTPAGGTTQDVTLYWRARRPPGRSFTVFVHAVAPGPDDRLVAQHDGVPGGGTLPTDRWHPGEVIRDRHPLVLPAHACGSFRLQVGWYERETLQRLPVDPGVLPAVESAVELRSVDFAPCDP
jgi:4-amino-4-deoxy-L-arabinose transferase-like glycosyltransferase